MSISSILNSDYSIQTKKTTKQHTSKVEIIDQTQELSEAEKLESFKKEIWNEINAIPRSSSISWSINITDAAFERMMNEPEFKEKMMSLIREDAAAGRPPIVCSITTIDENGYKGYSYNDTNVGNTAYSTHSKDKNNFYKKKAAKQDYTELWEEKHLERERQREILDEEYEKRLYTNKIYKHKEEIAKLYEKGTIAENQVNI